jgi:hypothetical protein
LIGEGEGPCALRTPLPHGSASNLADARVVTQVVSPDYNAYMDGANRICQSEYELLRKTGGAADLACRANFPAVASIRSACVMFAKSRESSAES